MSFNILIFQSITWVTWGEIFYRHKLLETYFISFAEDKESLLNGVKLQLLKHPEVGFQGYFHNIVII